MEKTRAELLHEAMEDWNALKNLYLVQTNEEYIEEVDNHAYSWHQTDDDVSLEDIMDDLISFYENPDYEDYLCTEESAYCVIRYLGDDYYKHSLYDLAENIYVQYQKYKKESSEE